MNCRQRDPELLLYGLGELSLLERVRVGWHLQSCLRCRARQAELSDVSQRIAGVLAPPGPGGGSGRGPGRAVRLRPRQLGLSPLLVALVVSVLLLSLLGVRYVRGHGFLRGPAADIPCAPGLPSDRCR